MIYCPSHRWIWVFAIAAIGYFVTDLAVASGDPEESKRLQKRLGNWNESLQLIQYHDYCADIEALVKTVGHAIDYGACKDRKQHTLADKYLDLAQTRYQQIDQLPWLKQTGLVIRGYRSSIDHSCQPYGLDIPPNLDLAQPVPLLVWLNKASGSGIDFLEQSLTKHQAFGGRLVDQAQAIILYPFGRGQSNWQSVSEIDLLEAITAVQRDYPIDPQRVALAGSHSAVWQIGAHYNDRFCAITSATRPPENLNGLRTPVLESSLNSSIETWQWLTAIWQSERPTANLDRIHFRTQTLRYPSHRWLTVTGLEQHRQEAHVDGQWNTPGQTLVLHTENVSALEINAPSLTTDLGKYRLTIDRQSMPVNEPGFSFNSLSIIKLNDRWQWGLQPSDAIGKTPGLQGPIDDAFRSRFIVVPPDHDIGSPRVDQWVTTELKHFRHHWRRHLHGHLIEKQSFELDARDIQQANLILWGTPASNPMIAEVLEQLPINWQDQQFKLQGATYSSQNHVPALICPNPINPQRYIVINSGLSANESPGSLLADWAVYNLDLQSGKSDLGRVVATGYFNEKWQ